MAIVVPILSKWDSRGVREAENELDRLGRSIGNFAKTAAVGIGVGAVALGGFAISAIKAGEEARIENQKIENIAKSMGVFGDQTATVVKRLDEYATKTMLATAIDDEQIKAVQAKLLTFEDLAVTADKTGGAFDRATVAALDLEKAGFGDAASNAVQLGKALQDPIKGLTSLTKSGVTFTDQQRDLIKEMVRTNRIAEAQDIVLGAIERQVGGTAAATATSSQKMAVAFGEIQESIATALLPTFDRLTDFVVTKLVPGFQLWWEVNGPKVIDFLNRLATWIGNVLNVYLPVFIAFVVATYTAVKDWWEEQETLQGWLDKLKEWLKENPDKVFKLAAGLLAVYAALKLLAIIQGFIAALQAIAAFGSAASGAITGIAAAIGGSLGTAIAGILGLVTLVIIAVDRLVEGFQTLGRLAGRVIGDILFGGFDLRELIPGGFSPGGLRPGEGFLPFAQGGIVTGPTLGLIGEAGPEAVIPLDRLGEMGGVNVTVNGAIDPVSVANQINRILQQRGYRNGVI